MAPTFSPDIIARVKDETDIVEVVKREVDLKAAGSVYKGLCPFHREKTPSFIVTPSRGRYHCFGCGAGGDVISFVMETEGVTFPEAVEILARPLDIDLSAWLREEEGEGERRAYHRANETAATLWHEALFDGRTGQAALDYLHRRGFGDKVLRDFTVGWAPGASDWLEPRLKKGGVDRDLAVSSGLVRVGDHGAFAYFRNRIMFPVRSISRQVAGFGGRVIDDGEPKYLNSSDSPYFSKGKLLYGFDASRMAIARERAAILVEGYLDLLALVQAGITNVVATCGTAFTPDQARLIRRGAPKVFLVFDGDRAGLKAAVRSADIALKAGLEPRIVRMPAGEDPASLTVGQGEAAMQAALASSVGYVPLLKALADERGGDRELAERAVKQALGTVAGITDPLRREYVLQETAEVFGLGAEVLRATLAGMDKPAPRRDAPRPAAAEAGPAQGDAPGDGPGDEDIADTAAPKVRHGRRVRNFNQVSPKVEADLMEAILWSDSGRGAELFLAERGDTALRGLEARLLARELEAWATRRQEGSRITPREFVLERWNSEGGPDYRRYVSRLISKEDRPQDTDIDQVIMDCLERLRRAQRTWQG
ncbi:MAG TPA: DNA primase [Candidatus Krumholzibacteria bacterium]|nr:DNA primase [Candidatus Krumholzibacteria bacterium]